MVAFTLSDAASDSFTITDGTNSVDVTTTSGPEHSSFTSGYNGADVTYYGGDYSGNEVASAEIASVTFADDVEGFSFDIQNVDQEGWDDQVRVVALDSNGDPVPITFSTSGGTVTVHQDGSTGTFVAEGDNATDSTISINIAGPVSEVRIYYEDGSNSTNNPGLVGLSNFDVATIPEPSVLCFASGTRFVTPKGPVCVEHLTPGALVKTLTAGFQPVRWIGKRHLGPRRLARSPRTRPVRVSSGDVCEENALIVSRQHGVLARLGNDLVLLRAGHAPETLASSQEWSGCFARGVTFHHILFDRHQVLFANGLIAESFYPGLYAIDTLSSGDRNRLFSVMPQLRSVWSGQTTVAEIYGPPAFPYVTRSELRRQRGGVKLLPCETGEWGDEMPACPQDREKSSKLRACS